MSALSHRTFQCRLCTGRRPGSFLLARLQCNSYTSQSIRARKSTAGSLHCVKDSLPDAVSRTPSSTGLNRPGINAMSPEFTLPKLHLLPPHFIDGACLNMFASKLEKGYGDKIMLSVAHKGPFVSKHVQDAVVRMAKAVPSYLLNNASLPSAKTSVDEFVNAHEKHVLMTPAEALNIFSSNGLRVVFSVSSGAESAPPATLGGGQATLYLLERSPVFFPPVPDVAPFSVPTLDDWRALWAMWDLVTLGMIPPAMLHQKPIDLRHKCLFYIGHIPTFLDMLMSRALGEPHTEPKYFTEIFERGINPHVDNPDYCHRHSEVPDSDEDWPTLENILAYRVRVRARLIRLYDDVASGRRTLNRHISRMLALTHEHEGWHIETLLYMLIQRVGTGTLPPPGFSPPPWDELATVWDAAAARIPSMPTVTIGPATITLGHDDCEEDDLAPGVTGHIADHEFGWDNEDPARQVEIGQVRIEWRPVTNEEYLAFWEAGGETQVAFPSSWVPGKSGIEVRTLYGPVPMTVAKQWPVLTSYDGLLAYATSKGGRLPTEPELRLFLDMYDVGHAGGANVGFRNWHPVPATTGLDEHGGKGSNGGIWEWTSTHFQAHEGLFPTKHFPGYSTDFFDGVHHVALGGSYATIPRLAGRRTIRNFYQHNYPYPWLGGRVVYDM